MGNAVASKKKRISVDHIEGTRDFKNLDAIPSLLRDSDDLAVCADDINNTYIFSKLIGKGQFGKIKEAYLISNPGRRFAIKVMKKNKSPRQAEHFTNELALLRALEHPNIVKFYETYTDSINYYLVLELCQGGNLQQRMNDQTKFPEKEVARILFQAFSAVKYLHKVGVAHRDIKPDNILFVSNSPTSEIKLADFGLSKYFAGSPFYCMQSQVGSDAYSAPEVLTKKYDEQCDCWSLGVILYMMVSGAYPFKNVDTKTMLEEIIHARFSTKGFLFKGVSAEAKDLINHLLVADPSSRYTATEALEHPFFNSAKIGGLVSVESDIVSKLNRTIRMERLQYEVLDLIVKELSDEDEEKYRAVFRYFDKSNNGYIETEDFLYRLKELGNQFTYLQAKYIVNTLNHEDFRKTISYRELIIAILKRDEVVTKNRAMELFQSFDFDQKGLIDAEKIKQALGRRGKLLNVTQASELTTTINSKVKGKINFNEFYSFLLKE